MSHSFLFVWQGFTIDGVSSQGEMVATNRKQVLSHLFNQDIFPQQIKRTVRLTANSWLPEDRLAITQQLSTMLQAGLPLMSCLQLLATQYPVPVWRYLLKQLQQHVAQGTSLSQAFSLFPNAFPSLYQEIIAIGELTGKLEYCCQQLAQQQEKVLSLRKKVKKALRYPLFILLVTLIILLLMLLFVIPEFAEIYQTFNAQLPFITRLLISCAHFFASYGVALLIVIAALIYLCRQKWRSLLIWPKIQHYILLRLPLLMQLTTYHCLSHLFRTLFMTHSTGISLLKGLQAAQGGVNLPQYQQAIQQISQHIQQGLNLSTAVETLALFPPLSRQLLRVGEETGQLELTFQQLADIYQTQTEEEITKLVQLLEPLMMVIIGGLVALIVVALYLPIFQLGDIMH